MRKRVTRIVRGALTWLGVVAGVLVTTLAASAQTGAEKLPQSLEVGKERDISVKDWLMQIHEASRGRAYAGTFVVSAGGYMSSARIWHVCDGVQQLERVESLSGPARSTFRRNDQVITFWRESQIAVSEKRESLGLFPNWLQSADSSIAQFYRVKWLGHERVAGHETDVLHLRPQDHLRFGYRVWTEKKTGLVIKLQTLDASGQVLEQSAFSELQLNVPVSAAALMQMMGKTDGYQLVKPELVKTTNVAEGWVMSRKVAGFESLSCFKRTLGSVATAEREQVFQWIFSDGLASVSLFVGVFDPAFHGSPGHFAMGATHTLTRRMGDWWVTAVGEVPAATLAIFVQGLERQK